jgi:hypothetical protein
MQPVEVLTPEDQFIPGVAQSVKLQSLPNGGLASAHGALCHRGGKGDHGTEGVVGVLYLHVDTRKETTDPGASDAEEFLLGYLCGMETWTPDP